MLPFRLVYHERYDLNLGDHVFPSKKYRWLKDRMLRSRFAGPEDFVEPEPATDDDVRLVHEAEYVAKLRNGTLNYQGDGGPAIAARLKEASDLLDVCRALSRNRCTREEAR